MTKIRADERAGVRGAAVCAAVTAGEQVRGTRRLVITDGPSPVDNGVEVWVRLYDGETEVRVDQHRVFINPPTQVIVTDRIVTNDETGEFIDRVVRYDPAAAFWFVLWDSVLTTPHSRGRRKR